MILTIVGIVVSAAGIGLIAFLTGITLGGGCIYTIQGDRSAVRGILLAAFAILIVAPVVYNMGLPWLIYFVVMVAAGAIFWVVYVIVEYVVNKE